MISDAIIDRVPGDLRARRAIAQRLDRPVSRPRPATLVRRLLAVQAQDPLAARLALRARAERLAPAAVDRALDEERSLVVAWLMRGTLHLVAAEDHGWLLSLAAPARLAHSRRRLGQEGVAPDTADRAVAVIERALADDGPQTRAQLGARLARRAIPAEGQALPHLLALAALRGVAVLGPDGGRAFALARDWVPSPPAPDRDTALGELARRYLAAHGPATEADLATWAGLPVRDARAGLARVRGLVERGDGLVDLARREAPAARIEPRLLGPFDPYLLGWRDRAFAVEAAHAKRVYPGGGMLRAVATVGGRVVGTWTRPRGRVTVDLLEPIRPADGAALSRDARAVERFLAATDEPAATVHRGPPR
jgi:Winged helix DNA-binding domain